MKRERDKTDITVNDDCGAGTGTVVVVPILELEEDTLPQIEKTWYSGSVPLGVEDDTHYLSELQVCTRTNLGEFRYGFISFLITMYK